MGVPRCLQVPVKYPKAYFRLQKFPYYPPSRRILQCDMSHPLVPYPVSSRRELVMSVTERFLVPALLLLSWTIFSSQCFGDSGVDFRDSGGTFSGMNADFEGFAAETLTRSAASSGRFVAEGYSKSGIPGGVLFIGNFSGLLTWVITNLTNETHNYTLTGTVRGTMDEKTADGMASKLTISTGREHFNGSPKLDGDDDDVRSSSVPEPSTLGLFGMGTFLLAGELRRRGRVSR